MDSSGSTTSDEAKLKVACIQMRPAIGKVEANVAHGIGLINRAAELGAKLIVLPELSNTGYMFQSREEAFALSEAYSRRTNGGSMERDSLEAQAASRSRYV